MRTPEFIEESFMETLRFYLDSSLRSETNNEYEQRDSFAIERIPSG